MCLLNVLDISGHRNFHITFSYHPTEGSVTLLD